MTRASLSVVTARKARAARLKSAPPVDLAAQGHEPIIAAAVGAGEASAGEVMLLIARLLEITDRIEELTAGQVDSVTDGVGRTTLLPHAQAELRKSEAQKEDRYRGLLEAAPDAMVVVNGAGKIELLNAQAEKQFGYSRDELIGQRVTNIIPEGFAERLVADDLRSTEEALAQVIGTGLELTALRKDGSEFPIEMMLSPLASADGILVTAAIRDISKRLAAEGRYRGLLEAAPDAMVVVNGAGKIELLNAQAEKQFGYSRDELIGQRVTNIIVVPEGTENPWASDGELDAPKALVVGLELVGRRNDGSEFPIEITWSAVDGPQGTDLTAAIRDISIRKAAEARVVQMEARYRGLLEAAPDAMVVVDDADNIILLNLQAERQFGYPRDELLGQPVTNIIPKGFAKGLLTDDPGSAVAPVDQNIRSGRELVARRKDGSEFPIEMMVSPPPSSDGVLVTAAIRDISAAVMSRRALESVSAELARSNRELDEFATIASHDLQEPLRKIQAFGDRLSARSSGVLDDDSIDYLSRMTGAAGRMQSLIKDLLQYSQVTGRPVPPRPVDLGQTVAGVLSDLDERLRVTQGVVHVGRLPTILANPMLMRQLFQNIIANALKFHPEGIAPEVHVDAVARGDMRRTETSPENEPRWEITIQDNGIGFDEKHVEKIFAPFQRLHAREAFEGTGMGLAICRRIVALHGGTITAKSAAGSGATFVITLPRGASGAATGLAA